METHTSEEIKQADMIEMCIVPIICDNVNTDCTFKGSVCKCGFCAS